MIYIILGVIGVFLFFGYLGRKDYKPASYGNWNFSTEVFSDVLGKKMEKRSISVIGSNYLDPSQKSELRIITVKPLLYKTGDSTKQYIRIKHQDYSSSDFHKTYHCSIATEKGMVNTGIPFLYNYDMLFDINEREKQEEKDPTLFFNRSSPLYQWTTNDDDYTFLTNLLLESETVQIGLYTYSCNGFSEAIKRLMSK